MNRPITVVYQFSVDDALRVHQALANRSFVYRYDAAICGLGTLVLCLAAILLLADEISLRQILQAMPFSLTVALPVAGLVLFWHKFIAPQFARRRVRKVVQSSPLLSEQVLFRFSDEGVHLSSDSTSSNSKWSVHSRALELESYFLLFIDKTPAFLPKTVFADQEEINQMRTLLAANLGPKAELLSA